jgi:hypothetical protein
MKNDKGNLEDYSKIPRIKNGHSIKAIIDECSVVGFGQIRMGIDCSSIITLQDGKSTRNILIEIVKYSIFVV